MDGNADPEGHLDKTDNTVTPWTEDEKEFLFNQDTGKPIKRTIKDFKIGLKVPGKLIPKRIPGGVLLVDTFYEMR